MYRLALFGFLLAFYCGPLATICAAEDSRRFIEPDSRTGTSAAAIVGNVPLAHTAPIMPLDQKGEVVGAGNAAEQAKFLLTRLDEVLREAGSSLDQTVKLNLYAASDAAANAMLNAIAEKFTGIAKPAYSMVGTRMTNDNVLVSLDAVAVAPVAQTKSTANVAILPPGKKIYVAGQAEKGDDLKSATQKTMDSLRRTLKFLGRNDYDIVQLKAFVNPVTAESEQQVREALAASLGDTPLPPLVLVEWESSLPIEIELVAYGGKLEPDMPTIEYLTPPGMTTPTIYSRVARTNHKQTIYISGLFGAGVSGKEQATDIFTQLGDVLRKSESDFRHLAKATYYVSDDDSSKQLNELRPMYYDPKRPPAASKALVNGVGKPGKTITVDMIAVPGGQDR